MPGRNVARVCWPFIFADARGDGAPRDPEVTTELHSIYVLSPRGRPWAIRFEGASRKHRYVERKSSGKSEGLWLLEARAEGSVDGEEEDCREILDRGETGGRKRDNG